MSVTKRNNYKPTENNSEINAGNIWCGHLKKWVKSLLKVSSACPNAPVNP
jgi:hypothetical protein